MKLRALVFGAVQPYKSDDATTPVRMTGNDAVEQPQIFDFQVAWNDQRWLATFNGHNNKMAANTMLTSN